MTDCGYKWADGWGEHECCRRDDEAHTTHLCRCDTYTHEES